jgi:4-oxalocrotonate tautomerase
MPLMPLVRITLARASSPARRHAIADAVHRALVETASVPSDDRFQIVSEASSADVIADPGYLGIQRSADVVVVQVFLNAGRTVEVKKALYARMADLLAEAAGLRREDLLVSLVEVARENWSFGNGAMSYPPAP